MRQSELNDTGSLCRRLVLYGQHKRRQRKQALLLFLGLGSPSSS